MNPETLHAIWRSGFVNRFHHSPHHILRNAQHTDAEHQWAVTVLIWMLYDSPTDCENLMAAGLLHDAPESAWGDASRIAKKRSPELKALIQGLDREWHRQHGTNGLPFDDPYLKMCDSLADVLYVASIAPYILAEQEWRDQISEVERMSWAISADVAAKVTGLLQAGGVR